MTRQRPRSAFQALGSLLFAVAQLLRPTVSDSPDAPTAPYIIQGIPVEGPKRADVIPRRRLLNTITGLPVNDKDQQSTGSLQAGCDHYRHGYLGLAMCVNYYDDNTKGQPVVLVSGSITNEGQVDICNLTVSVDGLSNSLVKSPAWLPQYPKNDSLKAGNWFPFSAKVPVAGGTKNEHAYPSVDVYRGFYACDAALKPLADDQVVPAPGTGKLPGDPSEGIVRLTPPQNALGSKIPWSGFLQAAGKDTSCLQGCLAPLNKEADDCAALAYVLTSGCISSCPAAVASWAKDACTRASCAASQCAVTRSGKATTGQTTSASGRGSKSSSPHAFAVILLSAIYTAFFTIWILF